MKIGYADMIASLTAKYRLLFSSANTVEKSSDIDRVTAQRQRRLLLTAITSAFARGVSVLSALITVPLALNYLGPEQYGIWVTLSSFALLLAFADLGIGNGVINAVSRYFGMNDIAGMRRCISTAYVILGLTALAVISLFATLYWFIPWNRVFNVHSAEAIAQAGPASAVFFLAFALAIPASIIQRVQSGLQEGVRTNVWTVAANFVSLILLLACIWLRMPLAVLVLVLFFTPIAFNILNALHSFLIRSPEIRPSIHYFDRSMLKEIMSSGAMFFILQISASVIFASNPFFIAQMLGAEDVATFGVVERLSSVVIVILQMMLMPLWPAFGEAKARGDWAWINKAHTISVAIALGLAIASGAVLVLFGPALLRIWINQDFVAPFALIIAFAVWRILEAYGAAMAAYMNGLHELKPQAVGGPLTATASVILKFWLVPAYGVTGAVLSMILAYLAFMMPVNAYVLRRSRYQRTD